jgi:hypothetical protein
MTKSPVQLARAAMLAARDAMEDFAHPNAKHTFTQPQLLAMLVLKAFFQTDYRGIVVLLSEWRELREELGLRDRVPHYSTLCYAERRLLKKNVLRSAASRHPLLGLALVSAESEQEAAA